MARVIVSDVADADTADAVANIAGQAGPSAARRFSARFERLYDRLADFPASCQARPSLGKDIRVGVVFPYLVIYRFTKSDNTVGIVRVLHGKRNISRELLLSGS